MISLSYTAETYNSVNNRLSAHRSVSNVSNQPLLYIQ